MINIIFSAYHRSVFNETVQEKLTSSIIIILKFLDTSKFYNLLIKVFFLLVSFLQDKT